MVPRVGGMALQEGNLRLEALILVKCSCDGEIFLVRSSFWDVTILGLACHPYLSLITSRVKLWWALRA